MRYDCSLALSKVQQVTNQQQVLRMITKSEMRAAIESLNKMISNYAALLTFLDTVIRLLGLVFRFYHQ